MYGQEKTKEELDHFADIVRCNCLTLMVVLSKFVESKPELLKLLNSRNLRKAHGELLEAFQQYKDGAEQSNAKSFIAFLPQIAMLWGSPGYQEAWVRRSETDAIDSHYTYMEDIERIAGDDYVPTQNDILLARVRTEGITTHSYDIPNENKNSTTTFEMYDVGGQRYYRKTWLHCFDNVDAIIYVASLSEYDQNLAEGETSVAVALLTPLACSKSL